MLSSPLFRGELNVTNGCFAAPPPSASYFLLVPPEDPSQPFSFGQETLMDSPKLHTPVDLRPSNKECELISKAEAT
jgi:hypothetical protein